jgi:hypothetical protein
VTHTPTHTLPFPAFSSSHGSSAQALPSSQATLTTCNKEQLALVSGPPGPHLYKVLPHLPPCALCLLPAPVVPTVGPQCSLGLPFTSCFVLSIAAFLFLFLHSRLGCSCFHKEITHCVLCRRSPAHFQAYRWSSGQIAQLGPEGRGICHSHFQPCRPIG